MPHLGRAGAPVFAGIRGGVGRLPAALASASGAHGAHRRDRPRPRAAGPGAAGTSWSARPATPRCVQADAVVLATPARATARLLSDTAPGAALDAGATRVRLDGDRDAGLPGAGLPGRGRFRVPGAARGRAHGQGGDVLLRQVGLGARRRRAGGPRRAAVLDRSPPRGAGPAGPRRGAGADRRQRASATRSGVSVRPVDAHVQRWGGALPQYAVGHLDRVASVRRDLEDGPGSGGLRFGVRRRRDPGLHRLGRDWQWPRWWPTSTPRLRE